MRWQQKEAVNGTGIASWTHDRRGWNIKVSRVMDNATHGRCKLGSVSENGIYGHSRFCNTDFDDKLACLNLSGV
jgi:hypothetical protein